MKRSWLLGLVIVSMATWGCGKGSNEVAKGPKTTKSTKSTKGGGPAPVAADSAEKAVMEIVHGLQQDQPEVLWHALPPSYQQDLSGLVKEFGTSVDPEIWSKGVSVAKKGVVLLKTKKEFILKYPLIEAFIQDQAKVSKAYGPLVTQLETYVNSDLANLATLKEGNVEKLIKDVGGSFMKEANIISQLIPAETLPAEAASVTNIPELLSSFKATQVKSNGDTATVRMEVKGEKPEEVEFVKVEGKWIPKEMADEWKTAMADARGGIAEMNKSLAANKAMYMQVLDMADKTLDALNATKTPDEFNKVIQDIVTKFAGEEAPPKN